MHVLIESRTALVLYGSETGNAQDVAEELGKICERLRFNTQVAAPDEIQIKDLLRHSVIIIAISTTGQGDLPANAQTFWKRIRSARLPPACLSPVRFASFGIGDSSYPQFNWAHRKLYNRLVQLGAQPICDRGESDEQHPEGLDGAFVPWQLTLRETLLEQYPLPDGVQPIADDENIEPKWVLDLADHQESISTSNTHAQHTPTNGHAASNGATHDNFASLLAIPDGLTATVHGNQRLTPDDHWQDVRQLNLRLSKHKPYGPGDVLTIYPQNFPVDVDQLLELMNWTPIADRPLHFVPTSDPLTNPGYPPPPKLHTIKGRPFTLRSLFTTHFDILSIPRRSFFASLVHYTNDEFHKERLLEFIDPQYIDELYDYTTRPRRSILEVLDEFTSVKLPWRKLCSILPAMRGRQFSIASGGRLKQVSYPTHARSNGIAHDNLEDTSLTSIELLIAIVKYKTIIKRIRQGVATRYIADLKPGQQLTVTLQKGSLGINRNQLITPIIMIGPGTGVAPMRSLIHERQMWREDMQTNHQNGGDATGQVSSLRRQPDLLFYGCRNATSDFFFSNEWEALPLSQHLQVHAAFSRDQRFKVYVQDLIRREKAAVFEYLVERQGLVYVCGSSGKMPQAVREALLEGLMDGGEAKMSREEAEVYFSKMERSGRYKQETW